MDRFLAAGFVRPSADIMCHVMRVPSFAAEVWPPQLFKDVNDYERAFYGHTGGGAESTNDQVKQKLFEWYQAGANEMTRGTWTGAEYRQYAESPSSGTSTRGTSGWAAQFIEWFVREETTDPSHWQAPPVIHFGAMIPRVWLAAGEHVAVHAAPLSSGGRVSLTIDAADDGNSYTANITLPSAAAGASASSSSSSWTWPGGGLILTIRSPAWPQKRIVSARVGEPNTTCPCFHVARGV
jgi:hypothetical protein